MQLYLRTVFVTLRGYHHGVSFPHYPMRRDQLQDGEWLGARLITHNEMVAAHEWARWIFQVTARILGMEQVMGPIITSL